MKPTLRVGIVGTRESHPEWWGIVAAYISEIPDDAVIATGDCPTGVDKMVRTIAIDRGRRLVVFHARWGAKGYSAGPARNAALVDYVDRVIALPCPTSKSKSSGTGDVIRRAERAGKNVLVRDPVQ